MTGDAIRCAASPDNGVSRELALSLVHDTVPVMTSLSLLSAAGLRWLDRAGRAEVGADVGAKVGADVGADADVSDDALDDARACLSDLAMHARLLRALLGVLAQHVPRPVPPTTFDLRSMLQDVAAEAAFANIALSLELPREPVHIRGNAWQLREVLLRSIHVTASAWHGAMEIDLDTTDTRARVAFHSLGKHDPRAGVASAIATSPDVALLGAIMRVHGAHMVLGDATRGATGGQPWLTLVWDR
ncbi:hypothetical protein [Cupriavidus plantarum]|uniref:hypothetical protein n=1 Tax=Cupriavidus plantarum TaxID=942865 RepID=UPI001B00FFFE|nr:hypothetical protein [Cupriavidus plantarum]CAG2147979.1 hypothetical protein LMG26296_04234 [Cupriavidus plantarum]SMR85439.1 hypothetical protein SAMN05421735_4242 [Cupriavidus plantarum]